MQAGTTSRYASPVLEAVLPGPDIVLKKVRPVLENVRPISQKVIATYTRTKGQFEMKLKFLFVSESVSVPISKEFL
jgi:hypothetical protein